MGGKLEGKVCVLTGATSGLALASAKLFVAEGAYVFITGRRPDAMEAALAELGPKATGVVGDSANLADLDRLYETVKREKGSIDVLMASAGGAAGGPIGSISEDDFDLTFDLNVRGTLFTVQKALPLFNDGGSIILTGSIAGVKGIAGMSVYCASKAAVRAFARSWTLDLKDRNIRVNVLSPGAILTPPMAAFPTEALDGYAAAAPMGRLGRPEEIASTALFLACDDSSFITGVELSVDGGAAQI